MTQIGTLIRSRGAIIAAALLFALVAVVVTPRIAQAHERRDVSGYQFVVGWLGEPAYEGEKNGLDLRIAKDGKPFVGAEQTLKLDVTHVEGKTSKAFVIRAIFNAPGAYTADLLPTASGVYRFRFTGTLELTNVDQTFTSGPGTFGSIEPTTAIQFPQAVAPPREVQGAARGAVDAAATATVAAQGAAAAAVSARLLALAAAAAAP